MTPTAALPCPFCGEDATVRNNGLLGCSSIQCIAALMHARPQDWNKRAIQDGKFSEHLAAARWREDMCITNHDGERVWLKPCLDDTGKRIGITDCCLEKSPCPRHGAALPIADVLTSLRALCQQWAQEPDSNSGDYDTGIAHGQIECANQLGPIMRNLELADNAVQATADAADEHIAYLRYQQHLNNATTIHLCNSDAVGAFKVFRKAVSPKAGPETLEHVHITDKQAVITGDPADLPDSVADDDPRRHNCDAMGCPTLDHVLYRLPFTDHRKPIDVKALARILAESIDFTAGPVQARQAFEKMLASPPAVSVGEQEKER